MGNAVARHHTTPTPAPERAGSSGGAARIRLTGLSKRFRRQGGEEVNAIDDVSLDVRPGEFVVLLGPSGCGKTTLLRCIAGLEHPDVGRITLEDRVLFDSTAGVHVPTERRQMSMLFQSYALWPHMTVFDNVAYPLRTAKVAKAEVRERVDRVLDRVRCGNLADQHPGAISGGQQQRVALARALVSDNNVVLFDEPLSNVDAKVRELLRLELLELQRRIGFSAVYVTHDQSEALALADRIAVLDSGRITQIGTPQEIYQRPASRYVARFVGTVNELAGTTDGVATDHVSVETALGVMTAGAGEEPGPTAGRVLATFRPECVRLHAARPHGPNVWEGVVARVLFLGSYVEYLIDVAGTEVRAWRMDEQVIATEGETVWVSVAPDRVVVLSENGPGTPPATTSGEER